MARELKQQFAKVKEKPGWQSGLRKGWAGADRLIDVQDVAEKLDRPALKVEKKEHVVDDVQRPNANIKSGW